MSVLTQASSYRTVANLSYPPHVVALACLYLAALLSSFEQEPVPAPAGFRNAHEVAKVLGDRAKWENQFQARVEDLEGRFDSIMLLSAKSPLYRNCPLHH